MASTCSACPPAWCGCRRSCWKTSESFFPSGLLTCADTETSSEAFNPFQQRSNSSYRIYSICRIIECFLAHRKDHNKYICSLIKIRIYKLGRTRLSSCETLLPGVPQGSVLGPRVFASCSSSWTDNEIIRR